jgi:hypothetical protein
MLQETRPIISKQQLFSMRKQTQIKNQNANIKNAVSRRAGMMF